MRLIALLLATTLFAADAPKAKTPAAPKPPEPPVYLTEKEATEAGENPLLQGEFANAKMGANVISLGKGEYRLVLFKGGLPGAGWDGTPKIEVEGKRDGEGVLFKDTIDSATLADGAVGLINVTASLAAPEVDPASPRHGGYRIPRVVVDICAARPIIWTHQDNSSLSSRICSRNFTRALPPLKSFLVMRLTTPAMASEP